MNRLAPDLRQLVELEVRQDEVLRQLDELDAQIARVLAECTTALAAAPAVQTLPERSAA